MPSSRFATVLALLFGLWGCSARQPPNRPARLAPVAPVSHFDGGGSGPRVAVPREVMLGIDVLEMEGFAPLRGKRLGLLTHPAGVDRRGISTIDLIRHTPGLRLVALFGTEHGIYGGPASVTYPDHYDPRTGLMIYSLYNGRSHVPTARQLRGIDALVIDLQDIGTRSYTFTGAMKEAMEGCFLHHVEVIVLDRPNPLGGLKVDGPMLDPQWMGNSLVNEFPVPYVHGLTIGELARLAAGTPGVLRIPESARRQGRLTVIAMRNWHRSMRWPETGLTWVPTSPFIPDFSAAMGYAMTGLGCQLGGFRHGVGNLYPFRGISNRYVRLDVLERDLRQLRLPGLRFRKVSVPSAHTGQPAEGLYIEVTDWNEWHPTQLSFELMRLACRLEPRNPFAAATPSEAATFLRYMGSSAFFHDLVVHGAHVNLEAYRERWEAEDRAFQERSKRFWLYQ